MKRRDALKGLSGIAGAAATARLLGGCGDDTGDGAPKGITTIVTVMMENRSYDHYLGARSLLHGLPGNGLTEEMANPDPQGGDVRIFHDTVPCVLDPPHGWDSSRVQWNSGANDGFLQAWVDRHGTGQPPHPMGYFVREDIPFLWALADHFAVSDAWYASMLGPTWPNRMYLHSAQSGGLNVNTLPEAGGISWPSIYSRLNQAEIDWAYYFSDLPFVPFFMDATGDNRIRRFTQFFDDADNGALPPVVFIDPSFTSNDDHPPHHPMLGQQFLSSIYHALAGSPQWNNSLLVITYDEHGGFYDHVSPPKAADSRAADGFDQLGFRVPTVVAGPYVKQGIVSSTTRDHTSVLAHIETMFGLDPLNERDAGAADLTDMLDSARLAAGDPRPPAAIPEIIVDESTIDAFCFGGEEKTDIELLADTGFFPSHLDARDGVRDLLYDIGDALDRYGAGRVRRGR